MPQDPDDDAGLFQAHVEASEAHENLFEGLYAKPEEEDLVAGLRRRRRRASNTTDGRIKTVSLVQEDGVLYWRDNIPEVEPSNLGMGLSQRRRRRRAGLSVPAEAPEMGQPLVLTRTFPVLEPNKIVAAVGAIDRALNKALDPSLHSRLRPLVKATDGNLTLGDADVMGPFSGRTLLFVHGTFSNAINMLDEFKATRDALAFLNAAMNGANKYDHVVFFEHATLAVSPVLNALELGRALAGSSGRIDVIAHSRGGLVVRWWLEAFGKSLNVSAATPVRAVLVGSPLRGTSLAAPDKLQGALSLISNVGTFAEVTLKLAGPANPFLWVAGKLVEVVVSATGLLARTPLVDGLVALIPGLCGQSAVQNNHEIDRLRLGPCAVDPRYFAVQSNFETQNPGWQFWKNFRFKRIGDMAADAVFPGPNDLVVDTDFMVDLGVPNLQLADQPRNFGTNDTVWHCNYFRQPETIGDIAQKWLT
jgi:pimeloyl-ACP methyl ester carboxylesterase